MIIYLLGAYCYSSVYYVFYIINGSIVYFYFVVIKYFVFRFFKNRCWLFTEFPEIKSLKDEKSSCMLEVGCGVGNSVFPILSHCSGTNVHVYCCDFSPNAIKILKENSEYNEEHCTAFVCDITNDDWNPPFALESLDVILLVFVLSAVQPEKYNVQ